MKDVLTLLADKYGCDKGSIKHNYTKLYHKYFSELRDTKFNMVEIGFGVGASVRMWLDYFRNPEFNLTSVDIRDFPVEFEMVNRLKCVKANQKNYNEMKAILPDAQFQIIIDDGSHIPEDMMVTFGFLFPYLSSGGYYVVEDLNCKRPHVKWHTGRGLVTEMKFIDVLKDFKRTGVFKSSIFNDKRCVRIARQIDDVKIHQNKIAFIKAK